MSTYEVIAVCIQILGLVGLALYCYYTWCIQKTTAENFDLLRRQLTEAAKPLFVPSHVENHEHFSMWAVLRNRGADVTEVKMTPVAPWFQVLSGYQPLVRSNDQLRVGIEATAQAIGNQQGQIQVEYTDKLGETHLALWSFDIDAGTFCT